MALYNVLTGPGCVGGLKGAGGGNQFNVFPPSPNDGREPSTLTDKRPQCSGM